MLKTRLRRKSQTCKVYKVKIDNSHLSKKSLAHIDRLFLEAKWFYNYCLSHENINDSDTTVKSVPVKVIDKFEDRKFTVLMSHMKQGIKKRIFTSLKALSTKKKNGYKVGRLKFKSRFNSISLSEYQADFDIYFDKNRMRLSGLEQKLRVKGLRQIPQQAEIANAILVRKADGLYFHVTTFVKKQERNVPDKSIGIDFGCQTQLTLSNGIKIEFQVPISNRLRRLDRKINKRVDINYNKRPDSKNKQKDLAKRRKEYQKLANKKKDIKNKVVNTITTCFKYVCFQDESIHAWQTNNHGKKIQNSGIGGIIVDLKHKSHTPLEVDKFFSSTQLCPRCKGKKKLDQSIRIYECKCGYQEDRDIHAAKNIEQEGMNQVPTDCRDIKPEEILPSTFFDLLCNIHGIKVSKVKLLSQEAPRFIVG